MSKKADRGGGETYFSYDARHMQSEVTDPEGYVTKYTYDPNMNMATVTRDNVLILTNEIDPLNRVAAATDPKGTTYFLFHSANKH